MKRSTIQIFALIGAISAGGAAYASQGHITGHHQLPENSSVQNNGSFSTGDVQHLDRYSDGTLRSKPGKDVHMGTSHVRNTMRDSDDVRGPLPPEAGAER